MKVQLLNNLDGLLDIIYTAARTCYNTGSPIDMYKNINDIDDSSKLRLIEDCIKRNHLSVLEHSQFTFAISGISRACSHQLVRHRHCSFSQQSQRYVEIKEDIEDLKKIYRKSEFVSGLKPIKDTLNRYFVDVNNDNWQSYLDALVNYLELTSKGVKSEDARNVLPNATKTNIVVTCNLRELLHICNERLCTKAQKEIRQLVQKMANEVIVECPELGKYLQPKCVKFGKCTEFKSCGRMGNE